MPDTFTSTYPYVSVVGDLPALVLALAGVLGLGFAFAAVRRLGFDV